MKLLFSISIFLFWNTLLAQVQLKLVDVPDYIEFEGTIDKYPITMTLFLYGEIFEKGKGKKVIGSYYYKNVKRPIKIEGEIYFRSEIKNNRPLYTKGQVELTEFDANNGIVARFSGNIIDTVTFNGNWKRVTDKDPLIFNLNITSLKPLSWYSVNFLEAKIKDRVYSVDLGQSMEYSPQIDKFYSFEFDDKTYAIVFVSYPSNGGCYMRGNCGCGSEQYLVFLELGHSNYLMTSQVIQTASCLKGFDYEFVKDETRLYEPYTLTFDFSTLELIINDYKSEKPDRYMLDMKQLSRGFVKLK